MDRLFLVGFALLLAFRVLPAQAQQTAKVQPDAARPAAPLDVAAIKRNAVQLAEFRRLLADPDPDVRLTTLEEAIRSGNASQREIAIEAGFASNESSMLDAALRGVLSNIQEIVIQIVDGDGKPIDKGLALYRLSVDRFDADTGQLAGTMACLNQGEKWRGQLQGIVMSFTAASNNCSGTLTWVADQGAFRGPLNAYAHDAILNGSWKPR